MGDFVVLKIDEHGSHDGTGIDADVGIKTPIFCCDEGLRKIGGHVIKTDPVAFINPFLCHVLHMIGKVAESKGTGQFLS